MDESRNLNNRGLWKSPSTAGVESERERAVKQIEKDERQRAPFRWCQSFFQGVNKTPSKIRDTGVEMRF